MDQLWQPGAAQWVLDGLRGIGTSGQWTNGKWANGQMGKLVLWMIGIVMVVGV
jgi:hypothetical protein